MKTASPSGFDDSSDPSGRLIAARYRVICLLFSERNGAVYEARDELCAGIQVAVKLFYKHMSDSFRRESNLLSGLRHDNIPRILDHGLDQGLGFTVMEFVRGVSLADLLKQSGGRLAGVLRALLMDNICPALTYLHNNRIVHCNLNPGNILLAESGDTGPAAGGVTRGPAKFKLLGFDNSHRIGTDDSPPSKTFAGAGNPEYLAPEQILGRATSEKADIYSVGVLLFRVLTGQVPFPLNGTSYADIAQVLTRIAEAAPPKPSSLAPNARIPGSIDELVLKCLQKDPAARPTSMIELHSSFSQANAM